MPDSLVYKKLSPEEIWISDFFQKHLQSAIAHLKQSLEDEVLCSVETGMSGRQGVQCESPLEAAFVAWWHVLARTNHFNDIWIMPQREVTCGTQRYRVDFEVVATASGEYGRLSQYPACPRIAIELDGHDFHERTKEQVSYRNQRDRALTAAGWLVWHFSGSEFHKSPEKIVWNDVYLQAGGVFANAMREAGFWKTHA